MTERLRKRLVSSHRVWQVTFSKPSGTYADITATKDLAEGAGNEFIDLTGKSVTTIIAAFCRGFADERTRGGCRVNKGVT